MPFKRYDSQVWWVSFTCPDGSRIRRSTGTTSKKEAEALELKWKLEVFQEKQWEKQPDRLFEELLVAYLHAHQDKKSAGRDISAAKHLRRVFEGKILASFCAQDVRAYIECRQELVKAATINRELCLLSTALNYGKRELEWDIPNPVLGRKLKQPEGRVRWITKAEASSLLRSAEPWPYLVDFIMLALHTGCRKQELLGLEWKRVDLQRNLIFLEAEHTKGARRRSVPLNRAARSALMSRMCFRSEQCPGSAWVFAHKNGRRITDVKKSFRTAVGKAGITDFRIHDLRHTCAAWLVTAGVALAEVRDLLGHRSVIMTEKYAHLAPENVRAAVAMLDGGHDSVTVDQIATEVA